MSDAALRDDTVEPVEPAASEPAPVPTEQPSQGGDDIARYLAEFDQAINRPAAAEPPADTAEPPSDTAPDPSLEQLLADLDRQPQASTGIADRDHLEQQAQSQRVAQLEQELTALWRQRHQEHEERAFEAFLKRAHEVVAETGRTDLPADFEKRWFVSEALLDSRLRDCWDYRDSPQLTPAQRVMAANYIEGKLKQLRRAVASMPDPAATEDRAAVVAAVTRDGSAGRIPAEPPPDLTRLSNAEFRQWCLDNGIQSGI
jgi:hypothetical protein